MTQLVYAYIVKIYVVGYGGIPIEYTASAVFLEQLVESPAAPEQALATALAAASANCLLPKAGEFSRETATALLPLVHIESF